MTANQRNRNARSASTPKTEVQSHFSEEVTAERTFLLASIVEYSDDAIITKTSTGVITSWNSGAEKIYGFSVEDVLGQTHLHPDSARRDR